ncbi:MAG: hypothetical protein HIU91_10370 [Acidobacteria bacterium]|nr:hypothetical protein [Acidobacteriota bacterium]
MDQLMENLTTTEAAVAAGVSLPQINRVIDGRILPDHWYSTSPVRTFRTDACLFIAFYYETADWLTASARLQTIRDAAVRRSTWIQWKDFVVAEHFLTVRFDDLWKSVDDRLHRLADAEEMVVEDPEILSGTLVISRYAHLRQSRRGLGSKGLPDRGKVQQWRSRTATFDFPS